MVSPGYIHAKFYSKGMFSFKAKRQAKRDLAIEKQKLPFDGYDCFVREHNGDGDPVGRCCFPVYGGYCPRHGKLADYIKGPEDGDDRDFPVYGLRTWPTNPVQRKQLGVREHAVRLDQRFVESPYATI
jgi:hypothetical protein